MALFRPNAVSTLNSCMRAISTSLRQSEGEQRCAFNPFCASRRDPYLRMLSLIRLATCTMEVYSNSDAALLGIVRDSKVVMLTYAWYIPAGAPSYVYVPPGKLPSYRTDEVMGYWWNRVMLCMYELE